MARKTKEDALATHTLLLDAAEHLFSTQGVAHTSLHEIAEAAGLTRGAIYWHFANKSELLLALWERIAQPLRHTFDSEACPLRVDNPLERLRLKASCVPRHIEHDEHLRALMTILMLRCEFTDETRSAGEHFLQEREYTLSRIHEGFDAAVAAGQLRADINTEQASIGLFAIVDGLCMHWLINPTRFPIAEVAQKSIDAYLAGLAATGPQPPR